MAKPLGVSNKCCCCCCCCCCLGCVPLGACCCFFLCFTEYSPSFLRAPFLSNDGITEVVLREEEGSPSRTAAASNSCSKTAFKVPLLSRLCQSLQALDRASLSDLRVEGRLPNNIRLKKADELLT